MEVSWKDIIKIVSEDHHGMLLYFAMWKEENFRVQGAGGFVSEFQVEYWIEDNWTMLKTEHDERMDFIIFRSTLE